MKNDLVNKEYFRMITIDGSKTCTLECPKCRRQQYRDLKLPPGGPRGTDLSLKNFKKMLNHFDQFSFCGQVSDPIFTPNFIEILQLINDSGKKASIATAATSKKHNEEWYKKAFKAHPKAKWVFGIDGLPHMSFMYRINQDGEFLFEMAKMCAEMCRLSVWQFIVFSYNEHQIDQAIELAEKHGIEFEINLSTRWNLGFDIYKPKNAMLYKKRPEEWKELKQNI
tara:strand:- start:748 stop:1419 length:672 start_codon:yes stop_codon:yes gene_type:complete